MRHLVGRIETLKSAAGLLALCALCQSAAFRSRADERPERPRITGIDHVTIYVSDVNKSRKFYSDVLGLAAGCPQYKGSEICLPLAPSNQRVLLRPVPVRGGTSTLKNWVGEVAFRTDGVTQMQRYLLAHGCSPGAIRKDSDGAEYFRVRDPEGNAIAFVQRSGTTIGYTAAPKQISTNLIHAGFVVRDMAAENRFYVDLLGFGLYWYGGFKDNSTDWFELQVPDGRDWIEYMLNIPAKADHKELGVQNHFSLGVRDVHAAARQLRSNGLETFDGPEIGRDGKDSLDAYDPDGTRVEIMDFAPVAKPCCHPYSREHPQP
jgi:catechol 2,3-dioxygenase-like lactoylglutathione lyase family enzyme